MVLNTCLNSLLQYLNRGRFWAAEKSVQSDQPLQQDCPSSAGKIPDLLVHSVQCVHAIQAVQSLFSV